MALVLLLAGLAAAPSRGETTPDLEARPGAGAGHESLSPGSVGTGTLATTDAWEREVRMRRFRFRRIRAPRVAEVVANVALRPYGLTISSAAVEKLPQDSRFWGKSIGLSDGVRRSKKKCNDGNDGSCGPASSPGFCRWYTAEAGIYRDYAPANEFCGPIEVCARFLELDPDKEVKAHVFEINASNVRKCLSTMFNSSATNPSTQVNCGGWPSSSSLCDLVDYVSTHTGKTYLFPPQKMGDFHTGSGSGDTPNLTTPAQVVSPSTQCHWDDPGNPWWGTIDNTPGNRTAQVEFDVVVSKLGCSASAGVTLNPCTPCPDTGSAHSALDLARLEYHEKSGCELRTTLNTVNTDLRDPAAYVGTRKFEVYFDVDNDLATGANAYPGCGAEYYVEFVLQSDGSTLTGHRAKYDWTGAGWVAPVVQNGMYDVRLEDCRCNFTIHKDDIGNPASDVAVWVVTRNDANQIVDELPSGVCNPTNRLTIALNRDQVCPKVVSVDAADAEAGNLSAAVNVLFDEPMVQPGPADVSISGPAIGTPGLTLNWNKRVLSIAPASSWIPGRYVVTLKQTMADCAGNLLAGDPDVCGSPYTFVFCVPNLGIVVQDAAGTPRVGFAVNEPIYLRATGLTGVAGPVNAYVMDDDAVLGQSGARYYDQTTDGPTVVTVAGGAIAPTHLGACPREGVYAVFLDVDGDGFYQENSDVTIDPCEGTFAVNPCRNELLEGLVAWWPLNETYSNAGSIELGNGSHGTHVGNPTPGPGQVAGALSFNGSNYVDVPNDPELEMAAGDDFSISGWINPTNAASGIQSILDMRSSNRGYHVALVGGQLVVNLNDPAGFTNYHSSSTLSSGTWTHFVCSNDRTQPNSLKIYLNGALDAAYNATNRSGDLTSGADLWIGGHHFQSSLNFRGAIDEIAIWDGALEATEVNLLYERGAAGRTCDSSVTVGVPNDPEGDVALQQMLMPIQNPVGSVQFVRYVLPAESHVRLALYDSQGRKIVILDQGQRAAGSHSIEWDARDTHGVAVPNGVYFIRLEALKRSETRKFVVFR